MSSKRIGNLSLPEPVIERLLRECHLENTTPSRLLTQILVKKFSLHSPEDKLEILRDLISRKYAVKEPESVALED
jgi:DNA-binding transcriptional MocR family regulator